VRQARLRRRVPQPDLAHLEGTAVIAPECTWPRVLAALSAREDLTADDTRWAMTEVWTMPTTGRNSRPS
jgi:hypothetical protein